VQTAIAALLTQACDAIVVVDNCSTDGTREWLTAQASKRAKLDIVFASRNLGGAGGFELGFKHAINQHNPEWLVCFDDDAYPNTDAFRKFLASDLNGIDAAAAAVYFPNGTICEMNRPAINPFWNWGLFFKTVSGQGRKGFHIQDEDYRSATPLPIDTTSFVGFFIRSNIVKRVGLPEGRLFIYGDDVLYTLSVRRAGGRICFMPWVTFTHDCMAFSTHESTITPLWKTFYVYRNSLRVYHAAAGWLFWIFLPFKVTKWLANARHYQARKAYLRLTVTALKDAAHGRYDRPHEEVVLLSTTASKH
jgi:GT2 family glycosyltransferase